MGVETVDASRYEVTTQERWLSPPRSPTIVGSATETIVWSSAARNMPSISAMKTVRRAVPVSLPSSSIIRGYSATRCVRPRRKTPRRSAQHEEIEPVAPGFRLPRALGFAHGVAETFLAAEELLLGESAQ